jgi:hypothetical protein
LRSRLATSLPFLLAHTDALACGNLPQACYEYTLHRILASRNTHWRNFSPWDTALMLLCVAFSPLALLPAGEVCPYTSLMADEHTVLEEAMDHLKEAGQRIRATQSLMRAQGMTDGESYRDLLTRLSTALAMTEAAYLEARRRRDL